MSLKFHFFSALLIYCLQVKSQQTNSSLTDQTDLINEAMKQADLAFSTEPLDQLIASQKITDRDLQASLYEERAFRTEYRYKKRPFETIKDTAKYSAFVREALPFYSKAMEVASCTRAAQALYSRFVFLKHQVYERGKELDSQTTYLYKTDLEQLKAMGYIPEKDGLGAGLFVTYGKELWIGAEFSPFSSLSDSKRLKKLCNDTLHYTNQNKEFHLYNALTLSYSRALESNQNELSFSLIEFYAPVVVIPAKIGVRFNDLSGKAHFFYRPTLGIGYKSWSLTYSYNLMFERKERISAEKHLFTFRFSRPFTNHRYRTR